MSNDALSTILNYTRAKETGTGQWMGHCSAHPDRTPSLSIKNTEGSILLNCLAGCETEEVVTAIGLRMADLFHDQPSSSPSYKSTVVSNPQAYKVLPKPREETARNRGITLEELAKDKKIPVEFLEGLGLRTVMGKEGPWVKIPYYDQGGQELPLLRMRVGPKGHDTRSGKGNTLALYGQQFQSRLLDQGYLILVEGESDVWSLLLHGIYSYGVPGNTNTETIMPEHVSGIGKIFANQEPEKSGVDFINGLQERLQAIGWPGELYVLRIPGFKDPNELHKAIADKPNASEEFQTLLKQAMEQALLWAPGSVKAYFLDQDPSGDQTLQGESGKREVTILSEPPRPLRRIPDKADPYPVKALGPILEAAVEDLHTSIRAPLAVCANSVLAVASFAVQSLADVVIDGRAIPLSEFFVTIAESGERKTTVDKQSFKPVRDHDKILYREFKRAETEYEEACKRGPKESESLPPKPRNPSSMVGDTTFEGLYKRLQSGNPSVILTLDEGGLLLGGFSMNPENLLKMSAGLSKIWDGGPLTRDRSGDGSSRLDGKRGATHLQVQTEASNLLFGNRVLHDQGLLSRILTAYPEPASGSRFINKRNRINLSRSSGYMAYYAQVREILNRPRFYEDEEQTELQPRQITLTEGADQAWEDYYNDVEEDLAPNGPLHPIRSLANKAPEHALRLAGILAMFDNPDRSEIDEEWMNRGITLMDFYLQESARLLQAGGINPETALAERLLQWLQQRKKDVVTLIEIYQSGPSEIRESNVARKYAKILEREGWLVPYPDKVVYKGHPRGEAWRVIHGLDQ